MYNERTFQKSKKFIAKLEANMDRNEMIGSIKDIFNFKKCTSSPLHIYLITDGGIFNPNEVLNLIRRNSFKTQVHTFGIGLGASDLLV